MAMIGNALRLCHCQPSRCRDLNDGVCRMSERRIIRRFSEEAVEVCNKVGLPPDTEDYDNINMYEVVELESEFDSEPMYEDEDEDYDIYAATSSSSSTTSSKSSKSAYDYDVYAATSDTSTTTTTSSAKSSKSAYLEPMYMDEE